MNLMEVQLAPQVQQWVDLILIWVGPDNAERAVLILATIVAFFPILANATLGLRSADRQLHELLTVEEVAALRRDRVV